MNSDHSKNWGPLRFTFHNLSVSHCFLWADQPLRRSSSGSDVTKSCSKISQEMSRSYSEYDADLEKNEPSAEKRTFGRISTEVLASFMTEFMIFRLRSGYSLVHIEEHLEPWYGLVQHTVYRIYTYPSSRILSLRTEIFKSQTLHICFKLSTKHIYRMSSMIP